MQIAPVLLRHPDAGQPARLALLSVEPASAAEQVLIRLATGLSRAALGNGSVFGPFPVAQAQQQLELVLQRLYEAGYQLSSGLEPLLQQLEDPSRRRRARAALALGWRADAAALPALLQALSQAGSELSLIIDALGRIGDPRAIEACREQAQKKLLSRRRSAVEALRKLGDAPGLAQAREQGLARLPESVRALLEGDDGSTPTLAGRQALHAAVMALEPLRRGLVIDQLYEFATPLCVQVALACLREDFAQPNLWRYAKSVWKRAMLRADLRSFAQLTLQFERSRDLLRGSHAVLRSGLDGQSRKTQVFGRRTQDWVVRASARWLRKLAYWQPQLYAAAAAQVLRRYGPGDAREPVGLLGPFGYALLLYRLLHAAGDRFRLDRRSRVWARDAAAVTRPWLPHHLPFAAQWDSSPAALLELAAFGQLAEVRMLGEAGVLRHPQVLQQAAARTLAALLDAAPQLARLAQEEVRRRHSLAAPDLRLCAELLDAGEQARHWAVQLLQDSAMHWCAQPRQVLRLLRRRQPLARDCAAGIVRGALQRVSAAPRQQVLRVLLQALEAQPGEADPRDSGVVEVLLAHAAEVAAGRSLEQVLAWVQDGDLHRRSVGGALLGAHPQALQLLGTVRLAVLADDEVQSVRAAACALIRGALAQLQADPWPLLMLADARFPDVRRCAFELLQQLDISALPADALVALCDSNHAQVQVFARDWIRAHLQQLDATWLLQHLIEHPHPLMRGFALELLEQHLQPGAMALREVLEFLRSSLLTPRLPRPARNRLLRLLECRGLLDAQQGALALEVLGVALRSAVRSDLEPVLLAASRIQLAWPQLRSEWLLRDSHGVQVSA